MVFERGFRGKPAKKTTTSSSSEVVPRSSSSGKRRVPPQVLKNIEEEKRYEEKPAEIIPSQPSLTPGQQLSQGMGNVGRGLWFGNEKGPLQIASYGPETQYSYSPSPKMIMAETFTNIGVGLFGGGIVRHAAPAAAQATGVLKRVYQGSKVVMGGSMVVGTGAFGYQTHQQIQRGDIRGASAGILSFTSGTIAFGLGAGVFDARSSRMVQMIKNASDINIRTGTPGSIRVGMRGDVQGRDILNTMTQHQYKGQRIGQTFQHIEDVVYRPSGKPELFIDTAISKPGGKIISFGGAEVQPRVIPSFKKPMRIDVLTGMEYRTVQKGSIRQTRSFIYTKYEPEFKPYVERTPSKFYMKEVSNQPSKMFTSSYKGPAVISGRNLAVEFMKPTFRRSFMISEMETPVFRVYPPQATFKPVLPIGLQMHQSAYMKSFRHGFGKLSLPSVEYSRDLITSPTEITRFINQPAQITIPFTIPLPKMRKESMVVPRQDIFPETMPLMKSTVMQEKMFRYSPYVFPDVVFHRRRLTGGGWDTGFARGGSSRYKFREFKIPELKL